MEPVLPGKLEYPDGGVDELVSGGARIPHGAEDLRSFAVEKVFGEVSLFRLAAVQYANHSLDPLQEEIDIASAMSTCSM